LLEKEKMASGLIGKNGVNGNKENSSKDNGSKANDNDGPTLSDVFDKKTYYNPGKIKSRLVKQMEKYEKQIEESEAKIADLKMQLMDPNIASEYSKLMELQNQLDAEEHNQETLLERMLETEMELNELAEQGF
jgi:ATP-binding cassette subfamily F protein 3